MQSYISEILVKSTVKSTESPKILKSVYYGPESDFTTSEMTHN